MTRTSRSLPTVGRFVLALSLLSGAFAAPAWAQGAPPEGQRTVEFYVQHPALRSQVNRACLNDPGHLRNSADCWNAHRADLEFTARETHQMAGDASNPDTPAYWTKRPNERRFKINLCQHMPIEHQIKAGCGPAQQSMLMEQQGIRSN